jgi:RNA polymerase sigma factor (sigma-70 family)
MAGADDFRRLMARIRDGDDDALLAFVVDYGDLVRRHARRELRKRGINHLYPPTELVDSVAFALVNGRVAERWRDSTNEELIHKLVGMVRNKCRERSRRERAQCRDARRVSAAPVESLELAAPEDEPGSESDVVERYQAALARLPELDRRLLLGRQEGRGYEELGAEVGLSGEAVRKRCARALRRLKRELGVEDRGTGSSREDAERAGSAGA